MKGLDNSLGFWWRILALLSVTIFLSTAYADKPFGVGDDTRYRANDKGDIQIIGNTVTTCQPGTSAIFNGSPANRGDGVATCEEAQRGDKRAANNDYPIIYVDIDGGTDADGDGNIDAPGDADTFNSSSADFDLPATGTVKWAGLYWSGRFADDPSTPDITRETVLFKTPADASYSEVTVANPVTDLGTGSNDAYSAFADVTTKVQAAGSGTYTVANLQTETGTDRYGSWSLVIVYADPNESLRNLSVFDGFVTVSRTTGARSIPISGFLTPDSDDITATIGFVTSEGDSGLIGDGATLAMGTTPATLRAPTQLANSPINPVDNFFNSTITELDDDRNLRHVTTKNPDYRDQLGSDIDVFDASDIVGRNDTAAQIGLTTGGETYYAEVVTFVTDIEPVLTVTKTQSDVNGGELDPTDEIEYTLVVESTGVDTADDIVLKDAIPENTTYVPGSFEMTGVLADTVTPTDADFSSRTDASGDDQLSYDDTTEELRVTLGTGAGASDNAGDADGDENGDDNGGSLSVGEKTVLRFRVSVDRDIPDGFEIINFARVNFVGQATGTGYSDSSSVAAVSVDNPDTDNDGIRDFFDIDDDNDGILDIDEGDGATDTDNDGIPDSLDIDSDNDGIPDLVESQGGDPDNVTYPGATDSDNDGLADNLDPTDNSPEGDAPANSRPPSTTTLLDTDGDGKPDHLDIDSDNDGLTDLDEAFDTDGDGKADTSPVNNDTDGDGLDDAFDDYDTTDPANTPDGTQNVGAAGSNADPTNSDADAKPNHLDIDSDNDGLTDLDEAFDTDGDGKADVTVTADDADGDGMVDAFDNADANPSPVASASPTLPANADGDPIANHLDIDSDNDGITDTNEAFDTDGDGLADITVTTPTDADNDGLDDAFDAADADPLPVASANPTPPADTDGDTRANHLDVDSDNDGITDARESGSPDPDGDGVIGDTGDFADTNGDGLDDSLLPTGVTPEDFDADGFANHLDIDADGDGITDLVEAGGTDADNDGRVDDALTTDANSNGLADSVDPNAASAGTPLPVTNTDGDTSGNPDYLDIDADDDGIPDNIEAQTTVDYEAPLGVDTDDDGLDDRYDTTAGEGLVPTNTDGGDQPDYQDTNSDNDALDDVVEGGRGPATGGDTDGDGLLNGFDTVDGPDVNDNITDPIDDLPDVDDNASAGRPFDVDYRETDDNDGDGISNDIDLDDDNDGIPDLEESGGVDPGQDADSDNIPDYADPDAPGFIDEDNNGTDDRFDNDGDGVPNHLDPDSDNDSIPDVVEAGGADADNDGQIDGFTDTDDDGLHDPLTADPLPVPDTDQDGKPNYLDIDSDNDGLTDTIEAGDTPNVPVNSDDDSIPDYLDIDADNDGIPDLIEAQPTVGYVPPSGIDADEDGLDDAFDADTENKDPAISAGVIPENTDDADEPDYLDADSDNDGVDDVDETDRGTPTGADLDNDGLDDGFDDNIDPDAWNPSDGIGTPSDDAQLPDSDADVSRGGDVDYRDNNDSDNDGVQDDVDLDDDNDGIPDIVEGGGVNPGADEDADGVPDYADPDAPGFIDEDNNGTDDRYDNDGDGIPNHLDDDSDNDGIPDVVEAGGTDADGDGQIDGFVDDNDDGLHDPVAETPLPTPDTDGDGKPNYQDIDSDGDGITDTVEAGDTPNVPVNSDDDSIPDYLDIDADNDGIPDNIESQPTQGYLPPSGADADGDGLDDAYDAANDDVDPEASAGTTPENTDGEDTPDYLDTDSDNDGASDQEEGGRGTPTGIDEDNDGLDDGFDDNVGEWNPNDGINPSEDLPNSDDEGDVDYRDIPGEETPEPTDAVLVLNKTSAAGDYTLGSRVPYTLTLANTQEGAITVTITDTPPEGTRYIDSTASYDVGGDEVALEPTLTNNQLIWRDISVPAGATLTLSYDLRILADAVTPLRNTAVASATTAAGETLTSAETEDELELNLEQFNRDVGTLIGRVYLDHNRNGRYNEGIDTPLPGARVLLTNGVQTLTDDQGNYAFRDVFADTWLVTLDRATAPFTPLPHPETVRAGYLHRVQVYGVTVSDFPLEPALGLTDAERETTVTFGPVTLNKKLIPLPDGVRVSLALMSSQDVSGIELSDPLPDGSAEMFELELLANEPQTLTYDLPPGAELTDPTFRRLP